MNVSAQYCVKHKNKINFLNKVFYKIEDNDEDIFIVFSKRRDSKFPLNFIESKCNAVLFVHNNFFQ